MTGTTVMAAGDKHLVEALLYTEARLLDRKQFDDWCALFTEDAYYWVPLRPEQSQPDKELSVIYDDIDMLRVRVHWLKHPKNHAQAIPSRTVHYVSNVLVDGFDDARQEYRVSSALQVAEYRKDIQTVYSGSCEHLLRAADGELKIAAKRVDLINSQAVLGPISVPL